jgi:hypothetical protein
MKEHPIIFSGEMVRAIIDWRKTQTRRVVKHAPPDTDPPTDWVWGLYDGLWYPHDGEYPDEGHYDTYTCPYGQPGDELYIKEAWRTFSGMDERNATDMAESCKEAGWDSPWAPIQYEADGHRDNWDVVPHDEPGRYRHARFMPKWLSRLTLRVTNVRVERVQEINEKECWAEGLVRVDKPLRNLARATPVRGAPQLTVPRQAFAQLWDSINTKRGFGWDINPWVWVIEFERVEI